MNGNGGAPVRRPLGRRSCSNVMSMSNLPRGRSDESRSLINCTTSASAARATLHRQSFGRCYAHAALRPRRPEGPPRPRPRSRRSRRGRTSRRRVSCALQLHRVNRCSRVSRRAKLESILEQIRSMNSRPAARPRRPEYRFRPGRESVRSVPPVRRADDLRSLQGECEMRSSRRAAPTMVNRPAAEVRSSPFRRSRVFLTAATSNFGLSRRRRLRAHHIDNASIPAGATTI